MTDIAKTGQSRVFTIENRAGPSHTPQYQGFTKAMAIAWAQGDVTPVRIPNPNRFDDFITIDEIIGAQGLPELPLMFRNQRSLSNMLEVVRKRCPIDIQVHVGACRNPSDFNGGWDVIWVLEAARPIQYGTGPLGALDSAEQAVVDETINFKGRDLYQIKPVAGAEIASAAILSEVIAVAICDNVDCGACGPSSTGVQKLFAITTENSGSPGLAAELVYTGNAGATIGTLNVNSLPVNAAPTDIACVGTNLVVTSQADEALHYAPLIDVLEGIATFVRIATGFVSTHGPNALFSLGTSFTWFVGNGGYVYFSSDIPSGVAVVEAGAATAQNLNDIHGSDNLNLIAVGASNAVIVTQDGTDFSAVTGPDPGVVLNCCWMRSPTCWFIGTAGGKLWYTEDGGLTWTQKRFSGDNSGTVKAIKFATPTVGYMAHATAAGVGRVFRTINGGQSWYALPEASGLRLPSSQRVNDIAVAQGVGGQNFALAGGLGTGTDGVLMKIA